MNALVTNFMKKETDDSEMINFLLKITEHGLTVYETAYLTKAMANSGKLIKLGGSKKKVADNPSTGGIFTKTPIIVSTLLSSIGLCVPKFSSSSLPTTRGTADILKAIPFFRTTLTIDELIQNCQKIGLSFIEPTKDICPADMEIYRLRKKIRSIYDNPGPMRNKHLLVSSILSKKLAIGCQYVIVDIKVGPGCNVENLKNAIELGKLFVEVGLNVGIDAICIVTNEQQPQGRAFGLNLAIMEIINVLNGGCDQSEDIFQISLEIASNILVRTKIATTLEEANNKIISLINNKTAINKFKEMVEQQGGDIKYINKERSFKLANTAPVLSPLNGYVKSIKTIDIDKVSKRIIIQKDETSILKKDYSTGLYLNKKVGERVSIGEPIATIYLDDRSEVERIKRLITKAYRFSKEKTNGQKYILGIISKERTEIF